MRPRSIIAGAGAIAVALAAQTATAQDASEAMPESAYDFISMMLNFAPEGLIDYESFEPLGDEGFAMLGVVMTPPGEQDSVLINRVEVERFDWVSALGDEQPAFITARMSGIDIPSVMFEEEVADIGYDFGDRVAADFSIDYDTNGENIDLRDLALTITDVIGLSLSLNADGIANADAVENPMLAAAGARIGGFSIRLEDLGGLPDIIAAAAEEFGMSGDDVIGMLQAQAPMAGMMLQGERGSQIADTLMAIVNDLPALANPVTISLSPDQPLTMVDFMTAADQDPELVLTRMGASIDY
jgi:hypothetical protein